MSIREASREFRLHRVMVRKMLGILGSADLPAADPAPPLQARPFVSCRPFAGSPQSFRVNNFRFPLNG